MSFPPPPPPPPPRNNNGNYSNPNTSRFPVPPPPGGSSSLQQGMNNLQISQQQQQQQQQRNFNAPQQANSSPRGFQPPLPPPSASRTQQAHSQFQQPPPPLNSAPSQNFGQPPSENKNAPMQQTQSQNQFQRPPPPPGPPSMSQNRNPQFQPPSFSEPPAPSSYPQQQQQQPQYQYQQPQMPPPQPGASNNMSMRPPPPPSPYGNQSFNAGPPRPPGPPSYSNHGMPPMQSGQMQPPPPPGPSNNSYGIQTHSNRPPPPPPNYGGMMSPTPNQQMQQQQYQQDNPKIDPSQIPRPPLFTRPNDNGHLPIYSTKAAAAQSRVTPPPPADSRFLVNDDGNASPQLMRSNMYSIPMDRGTWQKMGELDLGILCSPMALPPQDYNPTLGPQPDEDMNKAKATLDSQRIPVIQPTRDNSGKHNLPPPRCRSCQAYMNPYWDSNSNTCNFCGTRNNNTDFDVTCLQRGTVDFVVDGPYVTRSSPVQPIVLYALDLTCPHIFEYVDLLEQVGREMARHFQQQPAQQRLLQQRQEQEHSHSEHAGEENFANKPLLQQQRPRIGLCFVASFGVVVLNKSGPQGTLQAVYMPDVFDEPFCHLPLHEWTFDLSTSEGVDEWTQHIQEDLLEGEVLQGLRKEAKSKNAHGLDGYELSCGGAAMAFCADALAESGGRCTWISHRRPNFGVGSIRHRSASTQSRTQPSAEDGLPLQEVSKASNSQDEQAGEFFRKLQDKCTKCRVVVDIVIHSNHEHVMHQSLGLATQGEICRATCGKLSWISAPGEGWKEPLMEELRRPLLTFQGWDCVFKVRCSTGVDVKGFVSHPGVTMDGGGLSASPELDLSCVSPQTNVAVMLEHRVGGIPKQSTYVYVQSALLYSTLSGERRVRVSTLCLKPSTNISDIFLSIDFSAFTTLYLRRAVARLREFAKSKAAKEDVNAWQRQAREDVINQIVKLFVSYRKNTNAIHSPPGQLILPEKLQLLPLFGMCLLKSPMFRPSMGRRIGNSVVVSPTGDERAYYSFLATMVTPSAAMLLVHPYVFSIGEPLDEGVGEWRVPAGAESAMSELGQASYHSSIQLPPSANASMTCLQEDGVYLIDIGLAVYLFFGKQVPEEVKQELSHLPLSPSLSSFPTPSEYGQRVRRLVWQLRAFCSVGTSGSRSEARPLFPPVIPVSQGDPRHQMYEQSLMNWMVDDPNSGEKDYSDFLCKLHRLIREKMNPPAKN